jgi:AMP-polyphosphate phosphotransferase
MEAGIPEINEFERTLIIDGIPPIKLFLHITPDEQILRFKDRLTNPRKRWKLTYEDFRNGTDGRITKLLLRR